MLADYLKEEALVCMSCAPALHPASSKYQQLAGHPLHWPQAYSTWKLRTEIWSLLVILVNIDPSCHSVMKWLASIRKKSKSNEHWLCVRQEIQASGFHQVDFLTSPHPGSWVHLKIPVQSQAEKESASVILREKILTALGVQRVPVNTAECIDEMHLIVQADLRKPHQLLFKRNRGS